MKSHFPGLCLLSPASTLAIIAGPGAEGRVARMGRRASPPESPSPIRATALIVDVETPQT